MRDNLMKFLLKIFLAISLILMPISIQADEIENDDNVITIHYFYSSNCTVCASVTEYLDGYLADVTDVLLVKYNILEGGDNEDWFIKTTDTFNRSSLSYPYIIIGGQDLQGKTEIISNIDKVLSYYRSNPDYVDIVEKVKNNELVLPGDFLTEISIRETAIIPIIGEIDLSSFSLVLGAVIIGTIDGFNPCAMWILVFLITLLINLKDRKKMWILGLTFILTSGVIYYLIMSAWLQVVTRIIIIKFFQIAIGVLSIIFAFFSIKHFWRQYRYDTGCEVQSTESKRKLIIRAKRIISNNNLWLAIIGIAGIAITVNIIELACSMGLPFTYTTMLGYHNLSSLESALYILVYVIFFIIDDLLVFTIAVVTFKVTGISNKYAKYSNLFGGLIMLALGIILIFFPSILL